MQEERTVFLIGIGPGNPELLTHQAIRAVTESNCLIGAERMLASFPAFSGERFCAISPKEIAAFLWQHPACQTAAVVVSGDVGFYSAAKKLREALPGFRVEQFCGISSLQYFCARLGTSWEDAAVRSLHKQDEASSAVVRTHEKTFLLTGGLRTPGQICATLRSNGLGAVAVSVGENLSYPDERISTGTVAEFAGQDFAALSVMLLRNPNPLSLQSVTHGLEDARFLRRDSASNRPIPMTKSEVRAVSLAKLRLRAEDIVYDIGAGTGSVAIEMALRVWAGHVYAIEQNPTAWALLAENKARFSAWNLELIRGSAPDAFKELPPPDRVFIGGTSGKLREILVCLLEKNPAVRVVINAITLETISEAMHCFAALQMEEIAAVQLTVARAKAVGTSHMMLGQNPVTILSAQGNGRRQNDNSQSS